MHRTFLKIPSEKVRDVLTLHIVQCSVFSLLGIFCLNKAEQRDQWWFIWSWIGESCCITDWLCSDLLQYCETLDLLVINLRLVSHCPVITLQMSPDFASREDQDWGALLDMISVSTYCPPVLSTRCISPQSLSQPVVVIGVKWPDWTGLVSQWYLQLLLVIRPH